MTAVLGPERRVVATEGNQNNELGVPLTVLRAGADTDVLDRRDGDAGRWADRASSAR